MMIHSICAFPKTFRRLLLLTALCGVTTAGAWAEELRLAHFMPSVHTLHEKVFVPLAEEIKAGSDGQLTLRIYPAGALGKGPVQQYKRVVTGVADIAFCLQNYTADLFPRSLLITRPGISTSAEDGTRRFWAVYEDFLRDEYREVKLLGAWVMSPTVLMTREVPVRSLKDMRGMKVRVSSPIESELIQAWGGVPVAMPITESYNALNTGVVDAVLIQPSALYRPWNLSEPARYVTDNLPSPTSVVFLAMNLQRWQSLSPDHRALLEGLTGPAFSVQAGILWSAKDKAALERAAKEDGGTEYLKLTDTQRDEFEKAAQATIDKALEELSQRGVDGRALYQALRR